MLRVLKDVVHLVIVKITDIRVQFTKDLALVDAMVSSLLN